MRKNIAICLLPVFGAMLSAEGLQYTFKAGVVSAQEDMLFFTRKNVGYGFEGGAKLTITEPDLSLNFHVGHTVVRGKKDDQANNADVQNTYVGIDLLYPVMESPVTIFTGPTLNNFKVKAKTGVYPDRTWKPGWRLGVNYQVTKRINTQFVYHIAEWTKTTPRAVDGTLLKSQTKVYRPSWFMISAGYTF